METFWIVGLKTNTLRSRTPINHEISDKHARGHIVSEHSVDITEMVGIGSGAQREVEDWALCEGFIW